jgi:DNA helicase MCM8
MSIVGWDYYFPGEEYTPEDHRLPLIETLYNLLQHNNEIVQLPDISEIENNSSLPLDYTQLKPLLPESVTTMFEEEPELILPCLGLAVFQAIYSSRKVIKNAPPITPRLFNLGRITPLRQLKSSCIGKLVSIRGTVIRVGNIKPLVTQTNFICSRCEATVKCYLKEGKYKVPSRCSSSQCKSRSFTPDLSSVSTVDWQKIRIQEQLDKKDPGRVPRTIECELTEDLVDSCVPGDVITLCGIVKVISTDADKGKFLVASFFKTFSFYILRTC